MRNGLRCGLEYGLSDSLPTEPPSTTSIYATISNLAGNGANNLGDISSFLLNLDLGVEGARQFLTTFANNVGGNPQQLAAINAELNYLNSGAYATSANRNNTALFIAVGLGALYLLTRDR